MAAVDAATQSNDDTTVEIADYSNPLHKEAIEVR
jgi:hypothetical protein